MRKVKNNVQFENPAVMFARGVEILITDPLMNPSRYDEQELSETRRAALKQDSCGNLFSSLLRQFANL